MRIKKFVDEDMIRLMRRVKEELGPEAVIVSTSQSEDGRSELVAAVETPTKSNLRTVPNLRFTRRLTATT